MPDNLFRGMDKKVNVQEVLQLVGYPTDYLVLDFESFYDVKYTLTSIPSILYIRDERFELFGCGFGHCYKSGLDNKLRYGQQFIEPEDIKTYLGHVAWDDTTIVVKNAKFDVLILQDVFNIIPPYVIDVEDLDRHQDSRDKHSLEYVAKKYKLGVKGKTSDFKGLRLADMTPKQRQALKEYCLNDVDLERQLFELLLPQLTNPTLEIPLMRHTLDIYLNPMIDFDFEGAGELIEAMKAEKQAAMDLTGHTAEDISKDKSFRIILELELGGNGSVPMKQGKRGTIMALAQGDEGRKRLLEHPDERVRNLMLARIAVRSWPLHIKRVANLIAQAQANGGKLAVPLKYYGAHTGRWSGSGGINLQNLGGKGRGKPTHPLIAAVRGLLRA